MATPRGRVPATAALRCDHVALQCYDVDETHRFYAEVLGLPLVDCQSGDDWGGKAWLMMVFALGDGRRIALCTFKGTRKPAQRDRPADLPHVAFAAGSRRTLGRWKTRLRGAGVAIQEENHGDQPSIYFSDPNGIVLEITAPAGRPQPRPNAVATAQVRRWISKK
jgi:catechol 2,3-dioxygenase-like lactoylglutathione lyase family enzyme